MGVNGDASTEEHMAHVQILESTVEAQEAQDSFRWGWTTPALEDNHIIYINRRLWQQLQENAPSERANDSESQVVYHRLHFMTSVVTIHELGHLCMRWGNILLDSPSIFDREADVFFDTKALEGRISLEIPLLTNGKVAGLNNISGASAVVFGRGAASDVHKLSSNCIESLLKGCGMPNLCRWVMDYDFREVDLCRVLGRQCR